VVALGALLPAAASAGPLRTGITDPTKFEGAGKGVALDRTKAAGASVVRLVLNWHDVAYLGAEPSTNFWGDFDSQVQAAEARGLEIIASIQYTPEWINVDRAKPDPVELGKFAQAAAERYDGTTMPRIRYWQVWNEPNRKAFLKPQFEGSTLRSPDLYRDMVNAVADGVRAVDLQPRNRVIAGGLAPLGLSDSPTPLRFMRAFLSEPVKFDIWSHHPYTSGGPTHKAAGGGNVALGNLPTMRTLLRERVRLGMADTPGKVEFWVTEFSWDTKGPDPKAVPHTLHARWTSEALYRMWRNGVSLVAWFRIQDDPLHATHYQSGLYTVKGARKRSFTAFRFPFVAFRQPGRILVWGRTPTSTPGTVRLERKVNGSWRGIGTVKATPAGIFTRTVRTSARTGLVRAVHKGAKSLGFSLTPVPDRYVSPFGCGGSIDC
jgi:hypothetical protein